MFSKITSFIQSIVAKVLESSFILNLRFSRRLSRHNHIQKSITYNVCASSFWFCLKYIRRNFDSYLYYLPCVGWVENFPDRLRGYLISKLSEDLTFRDECFQKYNGHNPDYFLYDFWLQHPEMAYELFYKWMTPCLNLASVISVATLQAFELNCSQSSMLDTLDEVSRLAEWCVSHKEDPHVMCSVSNCDLSSLVTGDYFLRNIKILRDNKTSRCYKPTRNVEMLLKNLRVRVLVTHNLFEIDFLELRLRVYRQPEVVLRVKLIGVS